jgi:hypothetical protein
VLNNVVVFGIFCSDVHTLDIETIPLLKYLCSNPQAIRNTHIVSILC